MATPTKVKFAEITSSGRIIGFTADDYECMDTENDITTPTPDDELKSYKTMASGKKNDPVYLSSDPEDDDNNINNNNKNNNNDKPPPSSQPITAAKSLKNKNAKKNYQHNSREDEYKKLLHRVKLELTKSEYTIWKKSMTDLQKIKNSQYIHDLHHAILDPWTDLFGSTKRKHFIFGEMFWKD